MSRIKTSFSTDGATLNFVYDRRIRQILDTYFGG
jgi:hypothetical protein